MSGVERLARIQLNSADANELARFFMEALGFARMSGKPDAPVSRDGVIALSLGPSRLDLADVGSQARPYPADVPGWSLLFQHFAIVTDDMAAATARLRRCDGWTAISTSGPERLPESSGGVTAFKFRDPEGHPLELIAFPKGRSPAAWRDASSTGPRLGIDHSAISVADTQRSVAFYFGLGLTVGASSLNIGVEQARLDAMPNPEVEVTALDLPSGRAPHVELLKYRGDFSRNAPLPDLDDIAATRLVFDVASAVALQEICGLYGGRTVAPAAPSGVLLRDPDGHLVQIEIGASA